MQTLRNSSASVSAWRYIWTNRGKKPIHTNAEDVVGIMASALKSDGPSSKF